ADGDKVCLFRDIAGSATLTASVTAAIPSGRVFADNTIPRQKIVLATAKPIPLSANAAGTWTAPTTTTTSTTSTTVHQTTTTVKPTTTTAQPTTTTTAQVLGITETPPETAPAAAQPAETQPAETLPLTGGTHRPLPLA